VDCLQEAFPSGINTKFIHQHSGGSDLPEILTQNVTKGDIVIGKVETTLGNPHSSVKTMIFTLTCNVI
jgi:hypothetical protein